MGRVKRIPHRGRDKGPRNKRVKTGPKEFEVLMMFAREFFGLPGRSPSRKEVLPRILAVLNSQGFTDWDNRRIGSFFSNWKVQHPNDPMFANGVADAQAAVEVVQDDEGSTDAEGEGTSDPACVADPGDGSESAVGLDAALWEFGDEAFDDYGY